jgi:hypothetical protein
MQSVPITTDVVGSTPAQAEENNIMLLSLSVTCAGWWFCLAPAVFSTNKTDRHDITEILLNTIKPTN